MEGVSRRTKNWYLQYYLGQRQERRNYGLWMIVDGMLPSPSIKRVILISN
jgi:hypothetical protein